MPGKTPSENVASAIRRAEEALRLRDPSLARPRGERHEREQPRVTSLEEILGLEIPCADDVEAEREHRDPADRVLVGPMRLPLPVATAQDDDERAQPGQLPLRECPVAV